MKNRKTETYPAIFLDRDGVITKDVGYPHKLSDLHLMLNVAAGIAKMKQLGCLVFVITNQSGVARGMFSLKEVSLFHEHMQSQLRVSNPAASIDQIYVCPHHPGGKVDEYSMVCECRKPGTQLVETALSQHDIDVERSFFIGDRLSDIECGRSMGFTTIQILGDKYSRIPTADHHFKDLLECAGLVERQLLAEES